MKVWSKSDYPFKSKGFSTFNIILENHYYEDPGVGNYAMIGDVTVGQLSINFVYTIIKKKKFWHIVIEINKIFPKVLTALM